MQHGSTTCLGKKISRQLPTEHILRLGFSVCQESDPMKWWLWFPAWITSGPWKFYCYFKWMLLVKGMLEWIITSVLSSYLIVDLDFREGVVGQSESESRSVVSTQSCPLSHIRLFATEWTRPWNSPGQNTGVGSLSLFQVIFPTQGSSPGLPHCRWILYQLSHKGVGMVGSQMQV